MPRSPERVVVSPSELCEVAREARLFGGPDHVVPLARAREGWFAPTVSEKRKSLLLT